jgi:hypothetical protein
MSQDYLYENMSSEFSNFFTALKNYIKLKKNKEEFNNHNKRLAYKTLLLTSTMKFNFKKK